MIAARQIFLGRGGAKLPYAAEVEYLESTGTQWIDTGRPIPADFWFDATIDVTGTTTAYKTLLGARIGSGNSDYQFSFYNTNNFFLARYGTIDSQYYSSLQTGMTHIRVESDGKLYINESFVKQLGVASPSDLLNMYIFALNDNRAAGQKSQYIRLYSLKYGGTNEAHDFIPVRVGGVGYMYDRVSKQLFGNQGSGNFIVGPDVVEVEYLESTGTQYIDTLFKANTTTTRLDISLEVTDATSNQGVFGSRNAATVRFDSCNAFILAQNIFRPDWASGDGSTLNNITISPNTVYEMSITRGTLVINGETRTYSSTASVDQTHEFLLFNFTNGSDSPFSTGLKGRIRYARLYSNNVLVRDFVPVRVGMEGAMMDKLTRKIYRNQGTGAFPYGNDK